MASLHGAAMAGKRRVIVEGQMFFFTMWEQAAAVNVLTAPIWLQTERTEPVALMDFRR